MKTAKQKTIIDLDDLQQKAVCSFAESRLLMWDLRRPHRQSRNHMGHRTPFELERDGIGAELAHEILRKSQASADLTVYDPVQHLLKHYDTVYKEWHIDVKAITAARLLVEEWQLLRSDDCDGYAFFRVRWPRYWWLGYIGRDRVHLLGAKDGKYEVPEEKLVDDITAVNVRGRRRTLGSS